MNDRQGRVIGAAKSGVIFVRGLKNPPTRVVAAAARLESAVDTVGAAELKQIGAKVRLKRPRYSVSRAKTILLRKHLDPIAADGLEMFAGIPGLEDSLRVPPIKDPPEQHLKAAERVRRIAEEHQQEFIAQRDYSENFLDKFDAAVRDLEAAARVERGSARGKYTRATELVADEIAALRRAFDALDTRMTEAYLDDRRTLALWRRASRVRAKTGRPKKRE